MNERPRSVMALATSVAIHLAVLVSPGWQVPALDDGGSGMPLSAHLAEPAAAMPAAAPSATPAPRAARKKRAPPPDANAPIATLPTPPAADMLASAEEVRPDAPALEPKSAEPAQPASAEPTEPAPAAAPAAPTEAPSLAGLPGAVRLEYAVTMGDNGFVLGRTVQEFRHDGKRYMTRSTAMTTGLANLFKPASVVNVSEGEIVAGGLRPRDYRADRGKGKNESARFNWEEGRVALADGRELALPRDTQDMLSVFFQLALLVPTDRTVIPLPVVTGRKLEQYDFDVQGEESIDTPVGRRRVLHLRAGPAGGRDSTEVWLSQDAPRLPIKIRYVDRKGDVFEQVVNKIDFEPRKEGSP